MPFPQVSSHTLFNIPFNFSKSRTAVAILEVITPSMYASVQCTHELIHWNQGQLTVSKTFSFILYSLDGLLGGFCMGIPFPAFLALPHLKAKAQKVERCLKGIDDVGFRPTCPFMGKSNCCSRSLVIGLITRHDSESLQRRWGSRKQIIKGTRYLIMNF